MAGGKLLSTQTGQRLLRKLDEMPDFSVPRGDHALQPTVMVRCTSTTAAGGSGVAAQCFPAVILNLESDADALPTSPELGDVWLTVLGSTGSVTPELGKPYTGILSGDFEVGANKRPRVFVVLSGGGSPAASFPVARMGGGQGQGAHANWQQIQFVPLYVDRGETIIGMMTVCIVAGIAGPGSYTGGYEIWGNNFDNNNNPIGSEFLVSNGVFGAFANQGFYFYTNSTSQFSNTSTCTSPCGYTNTTGSRVGLYPKIVNAPVPLAIDSWSALGIVTAKSTNTQVINI